MYNRGTKYLENAKYAKALQCFKKQLLTHSFKELHLNMGNAYRGLMENSKALEQYKLANANYIPFSDGSFITEYPLALNNIGLLSYADGDDTTALSYYKAALTKDPLHYDAIWNYASAILRSTNCSSDAGWKAYEYRFKRSGRASNLIEPGNTWDGVSPGRAICVQTEQGLGDKIMFGRYLQCLNNYFEDIYVVCHPSLDVFFSDYKIVRSLAESGTTTTIGLGSLAQWFRTNVNENWLKGKFNATKFDPKKINIGVVWSGSSTHANNANRSCPSHYFSSLADSSYVLYSLNPADAKAKNIVDIASSDWATTASTILGLDCVVSVDTAIVHLCGTLGVPCIMLQPKWETDFRWGKAGDTNVWYSSVDVIHHTSWDYAFTIVKKKLEAVRSMLVVRLLTGRTEAEWIERINKEAECIEK